MINNPLRYNDPNGHRPVDEQGGRQGCTDPKYCKDGKPKSRAELARMQREKGERDWPNNPPWDSNPAPIEKRELIDILFSPTAGPSYQMVFDTPDQYQQYVVEWRQLMSQGMYGNDGFDSLRTIVQNASAGINNPLPKDKYSGMEATMIIRVGWEPYNIFLNKVGLGTGYENMSNYEPHFLAALMATNPAALDDAKGDWLMEHSLSPDNATIKDFLEKNFCITCGD